MSLAQASAGLSPWAQTWVRQALGEPTAVQAQAWPIVAERRDAVLIAPTGSGKTLAAFLAVLDRLVHTPADERSTILYVSPLKALASDIERNLRSPLVGLRQVAARDLGEPPADINIGIRTGDTPQSERTRQAKNPPDVWITTPESLYLLLTSQARSALNRVDTVIIDEVHTMVGTKRGAHLALSLERLDALLESPAQRLALSATVNPVSQVARYVRATDPDRVAIVAPPTNKDIHVRVESTVSDFDAIGEIRTADDESEIVSGSAAGDAERNSIWPSVTERVVDLIADHRSTIVFANSRRLAERITARINELAEERGLDAPLARAHHGSVAKTLRQQIEDDLKQGHLRAVVATSSMELGIDMGAVDLVVQIQSPTSVASGLQRIGRAGHGVGEPSHGHVIATHAHDLLVSSTLARQIDARAIEQVHIPFSPLDVLAQQIVAMCAMDDYTVAELSRLVRRAAPFTETSDALIESVLGMLAGSYPSDRFAELRPRVVWDRSTDMVTARPGAQRLAVTNAGTIPDRGLFGVHIATEGMPRVGELDEEMVYESRVGEVIALGASSWRIEEITHDRVLVTPAPGMPGRMPFWHGDALGRPAELAAAVGHTIREGDDQLPALQAYRQSQREALGLLPDERTLALEAFRDEIGDWRVVLHSPYGARVHAPWALAARTRLVERFAIDPHVMHADDGIVIRLPDMDAAADESSAAAQILGEVVDALTIDPVDIEQEVHENVTGSALFASRFRECAARSLLLPRRRPDRRSPLWQQRQRASHLLEVAGDYPDFPIILETMRECVSEAYDLPALTNLLREIHSGNVRFEPIVTQRPSPFARSLLFGYVANYMYEGDAPLAERRAQALSLDVGLLADLLGSAELRTLLDPQALADVEDDIAHRSTTTRARDLEDAADFLRILGPLDDSTARESGVDPQWLHTLISQGRAIRVHIAGREHIAAIEDAGRLRDALGTVLPPGIPEAHLSSPADPLGDIIARFARTHGPFTCADIAQHFGLPLAAVRQVLEDRVARRELVRGEFRPGGRDEEFCDREVLRRIRRSSVARLREEIEPVSLADYAAFLPQWHQIAAPGSAGDSLADVLDRLSALTLPASAVLSVLRARSPRVDAADLDALCASGALTWWGMGPLGSKDMHIAWAPTPVAAGLRHLLRKGYPEQSDQESFSELDSAILNTLRGGGAFLADRLHAALIAAGTVVSVETMEEALWTLATRGWITCDSWSAVFARVHGRRTPRRQESAQQRGPRSRALRRTRISVIGSGPRWSLAPGIEELLSQDWVDGTREHAALEYTGLLLERWGVVSRLAVSAEEPVGGFTAQYRVLSALADAGNCQRVYAVDGAGGAQFALPGTVDRLRAIQADADRHHDLVVICAVDPANPYGTVLPWPDSRDDKAPSIRPSRRTGALVALRGCDLVAWVDPSGAKLLGWGITDTAAASEVLLALANSRATLMPSQRSSTLTMVNGMSLLSPTPTAGPAWFQAAKAAGFASTPRGWRWPRHA